MLPDSFKEDVRELVALAKECPDALQEKCLQMLLEDYLKKSHGGGKLSPKVPPPPDPAAKEKEAEKPEETAEATAEEKDTSSGQRDLVLTDLHLKAKKFLTDYDITLDDINQLFFMEGKNIQPLYDDLKTTKASETQIRIGLLQALRTGMTDGNFQFSGEDVRTECQERKAYDKNNFPANFKNSAGLFAGFDKYDKASPILKLTDAGKKRLAETIAEMK
jgi:hypothetical protein